MVPLCVSFLTDKRDISALKIEQSNRWVNEESVDKLKEGKARSKLLKKPRAEAVVRSRWLYMLPVLRSKSFKVWVNNNYFHVFFLMGFRVNNTILTFLPSFLDLVLFVFISVIMSTVFRDDFSHESNGKQESVWPKD